MVETRTGQFPIGLRRSRSDWQQQGLSRIVDFALANNFVFIDTGPISSLDAQTILQSGLRLGAVDLKRWPDLASPDEQTRQAAVEENLQHVRSLAALGVRRFLGVMVSAEPARPRRENFELAIDGWGRLAHAIEQPGVEIVLEGAPGRPPYFAALGCTPADIRTIFQRIGSPSIAINYDPSHLVRTGIDPIRFLREFGPRVSHVHAKDTALLAEDRYLHGTLQSATFAEPHRWGGHAWRYCIPGRGDVPWPEMIQTLAGIGYRGGLAIELEDEEFDTSEAQEKAAMLLARDFLSAV